MSEITDSSDTEGLLIQAGAGNLPARNELFARYRAFLLRAVNVRLDRRLAGRVDALDIVQDAFQEALRRFDDYVERRPMGFRLWLLKLAQEQVIMSWRKHGQAKSRSVERELPLPDHSSLCIAEQFMARGDSPSQSLRREELISHVQAALAELGPGDRDVLVMRSLDGLTNQEVAEFLNIDPVAASKRYGRALLRLRTRLARHSVGGLHS